MKVKFKLHNPNTLRSLGHKDDIIRKVPFYLFVDKEHVGELIDYTIVYKDYKIDNRFTQYIRLENE